MVMARVEYPPFLELDSEAEYRAHFHKVYCAGPLSTFDDIFVRFRKSDFDHAFFESSSPKSKDDSFSSDRAKRMDFVRFSGEWFIYYALIALGGGVLMGFTMFVFAAIICVLSEYGRGKNKLAKKNGNGSDQNGPRRTLSHINLNFKCQE